LSLKFSRTEDTEVTEDRRGAERLSR
jgi:hypothetical protein